MTDTTTTTATATSTTTATVEADTDEILAVLAAFRAAHLARDSPAVFDLFDDGAVRYTLAPPLQQTPDTAYGDVAGLDRWFATFDGPVRTEHRDLHVTVGGDVALATALTRLTATPAGAPDSFSFWFRTTFGLRRDHGRWLIVHEHDSTPFYMDGSFRAATDLEPDGS